MLSSLRATLSQLKLPSKSTSPKSSTYTQSNSSYSMSNEDNDSIFSPANYKAHQRKTSSIESVDFEGVEVVRKEERQGRRRGAKGTGFPEPLSCDRNTTLPHPDADISPNATIEADLSLSRTHSRRRFLERIHHHRKHGSTKGEVQIQAMDESRSRSTLSLEEGDGGLYDDILYADGSREVGGVERVVGDINDLPKRERKRGDNEKAEESVWDEGKFDSGVVRDKSRNPFNKFLN